MFKNKTLKSIFGVTASNITSIISGIIVGFIIPKILTMDDYGLYKTFTLYTTYMGLFNIGIADGIVLKYGADDYEQFNRSKFRAYFKWFLLVHTFFVLIMIACGLFILQGEAKFIIIALAIEMITVNCTGYFQQISQITQRFKEFSVRKIIQSLINIVSAGMVFAVYFLNGEVSYRLYLILLIGFGTILTLWYFSTYKDIICGKSQTIVETGGEIFSLIKNGFPLLFANLCATLILTLDRQFVNILFDNTTYAVYAFAYNMLSIATVATSAASTVLYPTLKRTTDETLKDTYNLLISIMLVFVFAAMIGYYPLNLFVNWYLPEYSESLIIFRIIFPGLAISSGVTVVMHNYYKVLGDNLKYFKKSIVILIISGVANAIAYYIFRTTISISIASILTMIIWYLYVEQYFINKYKINRLSNLIYLVSMSVVFYVVTSIESIILSGCIYIALFVLITFMLEKKELLKGYQMLKRE